jgi:hypothetical protein
MRIRGSVVVLLTCCFPMMTIAQTPAAGPPAAGPGVGDAVAPAPAPATPGMAPQYPVSGMAPQYPVYGQYPPAAGMYAAPPYQAPAPTVTETPRVETGSGVGFHIGIGVGTSGVSGGRQGIATQFKIGARVSSQLALYYYALNHWYKDIATTDWRIIAVNGVGVDYYLLPKLGMRAGLGVGGDLPNDMFSDKNRKLGFSYFSGLTFRLMEGKNAITVDPVIHMFQRNVDVACTTVGSTTKCGSSRWTSTMVFALTLNWAYN